MNVGIVGYGWVGKAMHKLFPDALIYDPNVSLADSTGLNITDFRSKVDQCDIVFICVPTPNESVREDLSNDINFVQQGEGKLDTSIVEEVISWCEAKLLVVRSTVNPGDCDTWSRLFGKRIVMQPEYLGETVAHPLLDPKSRPFLILGGDRVDTKELIDLYMTVYNANIDIRQVTRLEAELIKLSENRAIAYKVAQCQELYDVCQMAGVDYYTVRQAVYGDDPRFNLWFTAIYPDKRGMNSKCIPKDPYAWCAFAEALGYDPKITRAILEKNKEWVAMNEND